MSQVILELNGRSYRLRCDDGDEKRLLQLGSVLSKKIDHLKKEIGNVGDERLFVMSSLMIVDEMLDLRKEVRDLKKQLKGATFIDTLLQDQDEEAEENLETNTDQETRRADSCSETLADHSDEDGNDNPSEDEDAIDAGNHTFSPEYQRSEYQTPKRHPPQHQTPPTPLHPAAALINSPLLHSKLDTASTRAFEKAHPLYSLHDHQDKGHKQKTGAELARELKEKFLKD